MAANHWKAEFVLAASKAVHQAIGSLIYSNENLADKTDLTVQGEFDPQILIFTDFKGFLEAAGLEQLDTPSDNGRFSNV